MHQADRLVNEILSRTYMIDDQKKYHKLQVFLARFWNRVNHTITSLQLSISLSDREIIINNHSFFMTTYPEREKVLILLEEMSVWAFLVYKKVHLEMPSKIEDALWKIACVDYLLKNNIKTHMCMNWLMDSRKYMIIIAEELYRMFQSQ